MRYRSRKHLWIDSIAERSAGVTLVELIMVIVISGIVATMLTAFIIRPIEGYEAQVRRAELVDAAEMTLRRMARDIRAALPNSVRIVDALGNPNSVSCTTVGTTCSIEILNTLDGARYREGPGNIGHNHGPPQFRLRFTGPDTDGFNVVGFFGNITVPFVSNNTTNPARLAIYNQGVPGADAYADANVGPAVPPTPVVITNPAVTTFRIDGDGGLPAADEHQILPLTGNFRFLWRSPRQRIFIVDTPVSYVCTAGANGNITRYWDYPITAAQAATPAGATTALLSTPVSACSFSYSPGTNQRAGLVTLDITVTDATSGDRVRLLHQVHVDNAS